MIEKDDDSSVILVTRSGIDTITIETGRKTDPDSPHINISKRLDIPLARVGEVMAGLRAASKKRETPKIEVDLVDQQSACAILGVSQSTLSRMITRRDIAHYRIGKRLFFDKNAVEDYVRERAIPAKT